MNASKSESWGELRNRLFVLLAASCFALLVVATPGKAEAVPCHMPVDGPNAGIPTGDCDPDNLDPELDTDEDPEEPAPDSIFWKQRRGSGLPDAGQSVIEPGSILIITGPCDGCGFRIINLTWKDWGSATAVGTGNTMPLLGGSGDPKTKVYLSKVRENCGERRYTNVRVVSDGYSNRYPDADCNGKTGSLLSPWKPTPKPERRLKFSTAKTVFNKTTFEVAGFRSYRKQSIRCSRASKQRVRCRGRWIYRTNNPEGPNYTYRLKGFGWVQKNGRYYNSKVTYRLRLTSPEGSTKHRLGTERGYFVARRR